MVADLRSFKKNKFSNLSTFELILTGVIFSTELLLTRKLYLPTTVGSKSTKTALGTCLPAPVSLKNVLKESSPPPRVLSDGIWPSGWMPCSRQYSSQQALPICTPAWPMWTEMHSLWKEDIKLSFIILFYFIHLWKTFSWVNKQTIKCNEESQLKVSTLFSSFKSDHRTNQPEFLCSFWFRWKQMA